MFEAFLNMVARPRIELGTHGFSIRCSTYWAITPMPCIKPYLGWIVNKNHHFFIWSDKFQAKKIPDGIRDWNLLNKILNMVARPRIELGTHGFSIRCSTYWAITPMSRIKQFKRSSVKCVFKKISWVFTFTANSAPFVHFLSHSLYLECITITIHEKKQCINCLKKA